MKTLFTDKYGKEYDENDVYIALKEIGADKCDVLFVHSEMMLGILPKDFNRKEYLNKLYNAIKKLGVKYLIVPTFTYSFCNDEAYDVNRSKTSMGALNEYIRKLPNRYRTLDPLCSLSVPMELKEKFELLTEHSLGKNSGLDILHNMDNVKFLFFGLSLRTCFTYLHYVEKMREVPYRYDMPFDGEIIDDKGNKIKKRQYIHTACYGVKPSESPKFENYLIRKGLLNKIKLGDAEFSCISEADAYREINTVLDKDINYFLEQPFTKEDLIHKYTYDKLNGRITHC